MVILTMEHTSMAAMAGINTTLAPVDNLLDIAVGTGGELHTMCCYVMGHG